ncbi:MAG TPA: hypothetical protein VLG50_01000 [Candidatus Saccharimonadales bacterium]|nr:hypothetical protein [Candidatus Saccharimonadales bacterium]
MKNFSVIFVFCLLFSLAIKACDRPTLIVPADQSKEKFLEAVELFYQKYPHAKTNVDIVDPKFENCKVLNYVGSSIGSSICAPTHRYTLDWNCRLSSSYVLKYYLVCGIDELLPSGIKFDFARHDICEMMRRHENVERKYRDLWTSVNLGESLRLLSTLRVYTLGRVANSNEEALLNKVPTIKQQFVPCQSVMRNLRESLQGRKITETISFQDETSSKVQGRSDEDDDGAAPAAQC